MRQVSFNALLLIAEHATYTVQFMMAYLVGIDTHHFTNPAIVLHPFGSGMLRGWKHGPADDMCKGKVSVFYLEPGLFQTLAHIKLLKRLLAQPFTAYLTGILYCHAC